MAYDREELIRAREEWSSAQSYFESVAESELVEYAVYQLEASRRRYMYLLRCAKASEAAKAL